MRRKLFFSYRSVLRGLRAGSVSEGQLLTSLFVFNCKREDILSKDLGEAYRQDIRAGKKSPFDLSVTLHVLAGALEQADAEGRIVWVPSGDTFKVGDLLKMLALHEAGKKALLHTAVESPLSSTPHGNMSVAKAVVAACGVDIQVVTP